MGKYVLNKHIRYRKEDGYILVCNCKRLIDYELPLKYFRFLKEFKEGVKKGDVGKENLSVFEDFCALDIIVEKGEQPQKKREDVFKKLSYEESEFV